MWCGCNNRIANRDGTCARCRKPIPERTITGNSKW